MDEVLPEEPLDDPREEWRRPTYALYTPGQIGLATFLGAPLAGFWFISSNAKQLGGNTSMPLVWGILSTIVMLGIAFVLPEKFPHFIVPFASIYAVMSYAKAEQGAAIEKHLAHGGRQGSWWAVVGVGLLSIVFILGAVIGMMLLWGVNLEGTE